MKARIYLKQYVTSSAQRIIVLDSSEIYNGERYFIGWLTHTSGSEIPYDIKEKDLNRLVKQGMMARFV